MPSHFVTLYIYLKGIRNVILEQEVPMCKLLIFYYGKSNNCNFPVKHTLALKI